MLAVEPGSDTTQLCEEEVRSLLLRDTAVSIYSNRSPLFVQRGGVTGEAVIVTGAAQGIGLGIAMEMARQATYTFVTFSLVPAKMNPFLSCSLENGFYSRLYFSTSLWNPCVL